MSRTKGACLVAAKRARRLAKARGFLELSQQAAAGWLLESFGTPALAIEHIPADSSWWRHVARLLTTIRTEEAN